MRAAAAVLVLLLLTAGCGSTLERRVVDGVTDGATSAPFYRVPDPLPEAAPGTLIRSERLLGAPDGAAAWRVLYHSRDDRGADIAVSGVVVAPTAAPPPGGRTVVSWAHPTTGTAPRCAPSAGDAPFSLIEGLQELLAAGYVVAATDYPTAPTYLIGTTSSQAVLDAARAARALPEAGAGDGLVLWGHSQGGHAVLFAAERAATYAPELRLRGVAAAAPAVELAGLLDADIGDVSGVTIGAYAFAAYAANYGAPLDAILTPEAAAAIPQMAALCLIGQNDRLHALAGPLVGHDLRADPATVEPWASLLRENTPGRDRIPVPVFVAQGGADTLVRPDTTARFVAAQCAAGAEVTSVVVPGADHGFIALDVVPQLIRWLAAPGGSTC
ncbi:alpha/beta hydrolase family protein [Pseudonocardia oroxyli]|uniref:Secretory lipase n=1 Tax=Pseudonocardia oroxyli TaxID=366584 RepID=A0A1G7WM25_PSEOR|nr:lipase family protein [Pseudonocardia oroxyli]SDG72898.1 Secretory lipase [Pseudonocardia oroxyli]